MTAGSPDDHTGVTSHPDAHTRMGVGKSPQRVIQRPRVPEATWARATAKARRLDRPIGHVIAELLDQWTAEDDDE